MISAHKTNKYGATWRQDLNDVRRKRLSDFFILLIVASNLGATKSIAPCEVTDPG